MGDNYNNANQLPPGFRFYPTDEELVVHFLQRKASLLPFHPDIIPDLDLYPIDPWNLDGKAMAEGNKWYFFSRKTCDRITENGYWEALGVDEPIFSSANKRVGMKKYHVFYLSETPNQGFKTNWIMDEYMLPDNGSSSKTRSSSSSSKRRAKQEIDYTNWVVCRVYEQDEGGDETELSCLDEVFLSLDDFDETSYPY